MPGGWGTTFTPYPKLVAHATVSDDQYGTGEAQHDLRCDSSVESFAQLYEPVGPGDPSRSTGKYPSGIILYYGCSDSSDSSRPPIKETAPGSRMVRSFDGALAREWL